MRVTSLRPWLLPTLTGPFVGAWAWVSFLMFMAGGSVTILGVDLDSWLLAMLLTSFIASGLTVLLIVTDVLLLKARVRQLPTGVRAWLSAMAVAPTLFYIWAIPFPIGSMVALVLWMVGTMAAAAMLVRLTFGKRVTE